MLRVFKKHTGVSPTEFKDMSEAERENLDGMA